MDVINLSAEQLRRAAQIKDQVDKLTTELSRILGSSAPSTNATAARGRHTMSAAGRARIAAAQRARWAKQKGQPAPAKRGGRRKLSAAAKEKIAAAAKARWAKAKAQGKKSLKSA